MGIATIVGAFGVRAEDAAKNGVSGRTLEEWAASSSSSSSSSSAGGSSGGQASAASASPSAAASSPAAQPASAEQEDLAEKLKAEGNKLLLEGSFLRAEDLYSQAIEACPSGKSSHVYFTCVALSPWLHSQCPCPAAPPPAHCPLTPLPSPPPALQQPRGSSLQPLQVRGLHGGR
jgi:hypothetical protein